MQVFDFFTAQNFASGADGGLSASSANAAGMYSAYEKTLKSRLIILFYSSVV